MTLLLSGGCRSCASAPMGRRCGRGRGTGGGRGGSRLSAPNFPVPGPCKTEMQIARKRRLRAVASSLSRLKCARGGARHPTAEPRRGPASSAAFNAPCKCLHRAGRQAPRGPTPACQARECKPVLGAAQRRGEALPGWAGMRMRYETPTVRTQCTGAGGPSTESSVPHWGKLRPCGGPEGAHLRGPGAGGKGADRSSQRRLPGGDAVQAETVAGAGSGEEEKRRCWVGGLACAKAWGGWV